MERSVSKGIEKGEKLVKGKKNLKVGEIKELYNKAYYSSNILINLICDSFYFGVSVGVKEGERRHGKTKEKH